MADKENFANVDLTCMRKSADDVLTKNGEKNSVFAIYKGTIEVEGSTKDLEGNTIKTAVTVDVKFKSDDKSTLSTIIPLVIGATRNMKLSLTSEDLDNHK
jgi:hypothetical protein